MPPTAPAPLLDRHILDTFDSGEPMLDEWLKRRARANHTSGASRVFVVCEGDQVAAYYSLSSAAIASIAVPGRFRRNMPDPIPVVLLGRLATDRRWQGQGIGRGLVRDAALRTMQAADTIGIRGLLVQAISERAKAFYEGSGFQPCPGQPLTLVATLQDLRSSLA